MCTTHTYSISVSCCMYAYGISTQLCRNNLYYTYVIFPLPSLLFASPSVADEENHNMHTYIMNSTKVQNPRQNS